MTWRAIVAPIIAKVLTETEGQPDHMVRKALREAYPFYQRAYYPYKIWCDEIQRQCGKKRPLYAPSTEVEAERERARMFIDDHQRRLF